MTSVLNDLVLYYDQKAEDPIDALPKRNRSRERVCWEFCLNDSGELVSVVPLSQEGSKKRGTDMLVPEHITRSSGVSPYFLVDKSAYFLGLDAKRGEKLYAAASELHHTVLDGVDDPGAIAVLAFFDAEPSSHAISQELLEQLTGDSAFIAFRFLPDGTLVHERSDVLDAWDEYCNCDTQGLPIHCSVTGKVDIAATLFPQVSGFPGATSAGASLVSFNKDAFCSYGRSSNDQCVNAQITAETAFKAGTALNYLVKTPGHRVSIAADQMIFWTDAESTECDELAQLIFNLDKQFSANKEDAAKLEEIKHKLQQIRKGVPIEGLQRDTRFHLLSVAPNAGRLSARFYEVGTMGQLEDNFRLYLQDTEMVGLRGQSLRPGSFNYYLRLTAAFNESSNIPSTLLSNTMRAALKGFPLPDALYQGALQRMRVDKGFVRSSRAPRDVSGDRAALMRAYLIRKARHSKNSDKERSLTVALNEDNTNVGYLLGRLFAILEKAQKDAVNPSATIRDRYIGAASSNPSTVFPQLLKTAQYHISKANSSVYIDRLIQSVMDKIDGTGGLPKTLGYDDQGMFFIGYYQQKTAIYIKRDQASAEVVEETEE
ncbi:MAG: type I-C CRISPR-associated protein Cas8c/Csd1 [Coriobacteriia bacterium]|nr:type I-C CRISPR-associated protein Cas8c/Csd1 [Coriobacteriia bacterium]